MEKHGWVIIVMGLVGTILLTGCFTGTIRGHVIGEDGQTIRGAVVMTDPPSHSVITSEHGFHLKHVPVGEYIVEADKPGYEDGSTNVRVQWNATTDADIQILPRPERE